MRIKSQIYFHRSHRKISFSGKKILVESLLCVPPLWALVLFLYPKITYFASETIIRLSVPSAAADSAAIVTKPFLVGPVFTPDILGSYPSPLLSYSLFMISLLAMAASHLVRIPKPIAIWVSFVCLVNMASALFFIFLPSLFPYSIQQFCELFIRTEIAIWLFIPVIMSASLLPLPSSPLSKFFTILATLLYAVAFGLVRYLLFVPLLAASTYVFMAFLFFCLGPFIDFITVVGAYSYYVSRVSKKITRDLEIWNWSS